MMRSLFAAVSGLKCHQQRMDVIGNNIANVNTPGYKRSRVSFQDMLNQTIRGASRPVPGGRGGTNPMQIGPGVSVGSIDLIMGGSSVQDTGKNTDLGIDGDGFFILSDGSRNYYTRVGSFDFDENGNLISLLNGMRVMGWMPND
ncbi:MAG: flagellar hook-basal body complex protein, partial [Syntrophaceticus sp.]